MKKNNFRGVKGIWLVAGALFSVLCLPVAARALTTISQGYSTTDTLAVGSIVSLKKNSTDQVVGASTATVDNLLGVVINDGNSLLTLTNGQKNQVQVATSGTTSVLVTSVNGDIKQGDPITASPVKGVGMKATRNAKVIGIAQGDAVVTDKHKQTYTDASGKQQSIALGDVPVLVNVSYYYAQPEKTIIPQAIQNIANALAGKRVETLPIILSVAIFIIALVVVVSIIYSIIRSSIISVGRNPMAQSAVYRNVIQLSALVLGILAVAIIAIYLILTRL